MSGKEKIEEFLSLPSFALVGASGNERRFGYAVFTALQSKGYKVLPVNRKYESIGSAKCWPDLVSLPEKPAGTIIIASPDNTVEILASAISSGIKHVWIQNGSESKKALEMAESSGLNLVTGQCILLHAEPVQGFHKFHRTIVKLFGKLYK